MRQNCTWTLKRMAEGHERLDLPQIWAGDTNAHCGRDAVYDNVHTGHHGLYQPTTRAGNAFRECLHSTRLAHVDTFHECDHRGTWRHRNGNWYELDAMLITTKHRKWVQNIATASGGALSNHTAKCYNLHISGERSADRRNKRKQRFLNMARIRAAARLNTEDERKTKRLCYAKMRGNSEPVTPTREQFETLVNTKLQQIREKDLPPTHRNDTNAFQDMDGWHIFTDGSGGPPTTYWKPRHVSAISAEKPAQTITWTNSSLMLRICHRQCLATTTLSGTEDQWTHHPTQTHTSHHHLQPLLPQQGDVTVEKHDLSRRTERQVTVANRESGKVSLDGALRSTSKNS